MLKNTKTAENLMKSFAGESQARTRYTYYARIAREEGLFNIAAVYDRISEVEFRHEKRYRKLLENIESETVFKKDKSVLWKCNNCGYIYEGEEALKACPACIHPQGFFEVFIENY